MGGVGALPDSIPLTKDPGCKKFCDLGNEPSEVDETLHVVWKWWKNDFVYGPILVEISWIALLAGWGGQKPTFWEKSSPLAIFWKFFNFFVLQFDQAQVGVL